ncbi:hypothetical protein [Piscirickettsia salmonis]|uniref:hypothetical protein n=1 Tax=Piscirickettsia salmonis TaxID=1238 RepID=UPI001F5C9539|nr:hypothetical protein [Piscirickettsia salmonis]
MSIRTAGFDLLAAEIGGTSTASIRTYADQSQGSRKQSLKGFIGELQREAINPVEIFLTKSIRELEKYVNNQSKPSFMDSSHAARRQFAQEKADRLRECSILSEYEWNSRGNKRVTDGFYYADCNRVSEPLRARKRTVWSKKFTRARSCFKTI